MGSILKEFFEPRLFVERLVAVPFNKLKCLPGPEASLRFKTICMLSVARSMSQDSMNGSKKETQCSTDRLKISVIQELEHHDPHLFVASVAEVHPGFAWPEARVWTRKMGGCGLMWISG